MGRPNQLWETTSLQIWARVRQWGWHGTSSQQGKGSESSKTTGRTRTQRTWIDTLAMPQWVCNLCQKERKSRQPPKTAKQTTSDTNGLLLHRSIQWQASTTCSHSNWRWDRYDNGSTCTRQAQAVQLFGHMRTNLPCWMWKSTSHTEPNNPTNWPRELPAGTPQSNSIITGKQRLSETNYRPTLHNHKAALSDFTGHWLDKSGLWCNR